MHSDQYFRHLETIARAIAELLRPHAEVVLHDIAADRITFIANPFSGRKAGDPALLDAELGNWKNGEDVLGPYEKAGDKGQRIRSISTVIRDDAGTPYALMCINLDFSALDSAVAVLEGFLQGPVAAPRPEALFRRDWRETIKLEVRAFALEAGLSIDKLDAANRLALVHRLLEQGLFCARKSVEQVAGMLGVSRATLYNDLARFKKKRN